MCYYNTRERETPPKLKGDKKNEIHPEHRVRQHLPRHHPGPARGFPRGLRTVRPARPHQWASLLGPVPDHRGLRNQPPFLCFSRAPTAQARGFRINIQFCEYLCEISTRRKWVLTSRNCVWIFIRLYNYTSKSKRVEGLSTSPLRGWPRDWTPIGAAYQPSPTAFGFGDLPLNLDTIIPHNTKKSILFLKFAFVILYKLSANSLSKMTNANFVKSLDFPGKMRYN